MTKASAFRTLHSKSACWIASNTSALKPNQAASYMAVCAYPASAEETKQRQKHALHKRQHPHRVSTASKASEASKACTDCERLHLRRCKSARLVIASATFCGTTSTLRRTPALVSFLELLLGRSKPLVSLSFLLSPVTLLDLCRSSLNSSPFSHSDDPFKAYGQSKTANILFAKVRFDRLFYRLLISV